MTAGPEIIIISLFGRTSLDEDLDCVELFSGIGAISKAFRWELTSSVEIFNQALVWLLMYFFALMKLRVV